MRGKIVTLLLASTFALPAAAQSVQSRALDRAVEINLQQAMERLQAQRKLIAQQQADVKATNKQASALTVKKPAREKPHTK